MYLSQIEYLFSCLGPSPFLSFFVQFSYFLLSDSTWRPKASPDTLQTPQMIKNGAPGPQNCQKKTKHELQNVFKTTLQTSTEQPIRKKLKKQSIATELPKRRKHWRCGGLALAFSITSCRLCWLFGPCLLQNSCFCGPLLVARFVFLFLLACRQWMVRA